MNRNNRLYSISADGEQVSTATGFLLQFWALSEGAGGVLDSQDRVLARRVFDTVIEAWHDGAAPACLTTGRPASEMSDVQLMQVIDTIEEACTALGAARVFEIIYRPDQASVH